MSKPEVIKIDEVEYVRKGLRLLGYKTTNPRHPNSNGSDLFAIKSDYVLSVEIKRAIQSKGRGVFRTRRVTRIHDDLIAIVFPCGYVLIEPMRDHLKCCNKHGDRFINI